MKPPPLEPMFALPAVEVLKKFVEPVPSRKMLAMSAVEVSRKFI
jgi:hypothetical protein